MDVGDLALLEEAVADDVLSTFLLASLDQTDHSVNVCKVVPRLRDLGLVGSDDTADLGALLLKRLNDEQTPRRARARLRISAETVRYARSARRDSRRPASPQRGTLPPLHAIVADQCYSARLT